MSSGTNALTSRGGSDRGQGQHSRTEGLGRGRVINATLAVTLVAFASFGCESAGVGPSAGEATTGAGTPVAHCEEVEFVVTKTAISAAIPTVGIVEWSLTGGVASTAKIVFELVDAPSSTLNRGGIAPVTLDNANYRTTLLGLKQSSNYTFRIAAEVDAEPCVSAAYTLPQTGSFVESQPVVVEVLQPTKREAGFIVTSSGASIPHRAFIIDADGDVVWQAEAPANATRALMDYEGEHMWMLSLNLTNERGEMRYVSMDGETEVRDVPGLETTHHDFTVLPGGRVAALAWVAAGIDPESKLVIRSPDGTITSPFRIGRNLYLSDAYHANAVHYVPSDESFTISDRNPSVLVKVSATGEPQWQLGGTCEAAPAGSQCAAKNWQVTHGHHLLDDGTFVVFNNTYDEWSRGVEFKLETSPESFIATVVADYEGDAHSATLGDIQRLPGGNTLVTYSAARKMSELDSDWNVVQTFSVPVGYASWRPTLYGAPPRP